MTSPFAGMPFLRRTEDAIPAETWNLWRRWRRRFGSRLEMPLTCRPGTGLLVTDEYWVMVDVTNQGVPLILWTEFATEGRDALHADMPCFVQYYDYPGARFHDAVLKEVTERMRQDLTRADRE